jgi:hypothetical protein
MIISELWGGLGNQMFCYAAGRAVAERLHTNLILNPNNVNLHGWRKYRPKNKNATIRDAYVLSNLNIKADFIKRFDLSQYFLPIYKEKGFEYDSNINLVGDNTRLQGYFQSEKYFKSIEHFLRTEFTPNGCIFGHRIYKDTISIHIRRGDYVTNSNAFKVHGILPLEYYYDAIDIIASNVKNPVFKIFTEDIAWVKENLKIPYPHAFVYSSLDYMDLHHMSLCNHHIIANSSFSWWGAWLCRADDKIVISPKQWFADKDMNAKTNDLIPDGWLRI